MCIRIISEEGKEWKSRWINPRGEGTEWASIRAWEAVSSLERRLGTTTGMGQTNRLALASRESPDSPGVIRGDPRSLTIHQRRIFKLVP